MTLQRRFSILSSKSWLLVVCCVALTISACSDRQDDGNAALPPTSTALDPELSERGNTDSGVVEVLSATQQAAAHELISRYLQQASADFGSAQSALQAMQSAVTKLLAAPGPDSLEAARTSWLRALNAYETTLLHRYYAELILPEQDYLHLVQLNYRLNQWPVLPGYIDAVANYPDSGIVFDPSVAIDRTTLAEIHGQFDLAEAALGFHVLEFLLWGDSLNLGGPRDADDFRAITVLSAEQAESGLTLEQLPNNRRRDLLQEVSSILNADYEAVYLIWTEHVADFQRRVDTQPASVLVSQLLQAINGLLTEELLVRSLYPLLNGNYDESLQSQFSNATQQNVMAQIGSIERVLLDISTEQGVRLDALFSDLSEDFGELFYQNFDASKECLVLLYNSISEPETPEAALEAEFEIVECINLLTSMIDHFSRIEQQLNGL